MSFPCPTMQYFDNLYCLWRNKQLEADIKESTTRAAWLPIFSDRHQSSKQSTLVSSPSPSYHLMFQHFFRAIVLNRWPPVYTIRTLILLLAKKKVGFFRPKIGCILDFNNKHQNQPLEQITKMTLPFFGTTFPSQYYDYNEISCQQLKWNLIIFLTCKSQ